MTKATKRLKAQYRTEHTTVHKTVIGTGEAQRIVKRRKRNPGSPSLKEWADGTRDGVAWLRRKDGGA